MSTKKTKIDLAEQFQLKPQQLNALLKELEMPHRQAYEGDELAKIEAKIASSNQKTDGKPQAKPQSPFDQVIGEINNQSNRATENQAQTAAALKQQAQQAAADLTIAGNVLTAYYVQTGNYDDPELADQVKASEAFLGQAIANTSGTTYRLGKLLAGANIEAFNQLPAVQAESPKLLNGSSAPA